MERLTIERNRVIVAALVVVAIATLYSAITYMSSYLNAVAERDKRAAIPVGVARAQKECLKEHIETGSCYALTGFASTTECDGKVCWVVYVKARNQYVFSASVIVAKDDGRLADVSYIRDSVSR